MGHLPHHAEGLPHLGLGYYSTITSLDCMLLTTAPAKILVNLFPFLQKFLDETLTMYKIDVIFNCAYSSSVQVRVIES